MNDTKQPLRAVALRFFALALGLALLAMGLRLCNLFFFFDSELGYYVPGAALPIVEWVCLGVSAALLLTGSILLFRKKVIGYPKRTPVAVRIGASLATLGFGAFFAADVIAYAVSRETTEGGITSGLIPLLLGGAATAYFLLVALNVKTESIRLLTGFCVILRLITALSGSYFNFFVPMNAPDKLMFQLGILSALLFMVSEIRATVSAPRSVLYMFSAGGAMIFTGACSLPSIIASYKLILHQTDTVYCNFSLFGFFLYVILRFLCLCLAPTPEEITAEEMESAEDIENAKNTEEATTEEADADPLPTPSETEENEP